MATRAEAWATAKVMVVRDNATYTEAAAATGLPVSTIQKRAATEEWQADRETAVSYDASIRKMKRDLLAQVMEAIEAKRDASQLVFAWKTAEAAFPEHRYSPTKTDPKAKLAIAADLIEVVVEYLAEHDTVALAKLEPHLTPIAKRLEVRCNG